MKSIKGLIIKFVIITASLLLILGAYGVSIVNILLISTLITGVGFVGDLLILPSIGNIKMAAIDFVLTFVVVWIMGALFFDNAIPLVTVSAISAIIIAFSEYPFHLYMLEQVISVKHAKSHTTLDRYRGQDMLTEFGSEHDIKRPADDGEENKK